MVEVHVDVAEVVIPPEGGELLVAPVEVHLVAVGDVVLERDIHQLENALEYLHALDVDRCLCLVVYRVGVIDVEVVEVLEYAVVRVRGGDGERAREVRPRRPEVGQVFGLLDERDVFPCEQVSGDSSDD